MFENAKILIEQYPRIILHRHNNPDGDALGSQIGLKHLILDNYPDKQVYAVGDLPGRYAFMEDSQPDTLPDDWYHGALAIILDTSAATLISDNRYTFADETLRIDHHLFCETIANTEIVESSYESCCGLVTAMALECGWKFSPLSAKSLYCGMVTDSGRFRYDSVTARTHRLAAALLEVPFSTAEIFNELYADDFNMVQMRAGFVLKIRRFSPNVAYIYTTREEAEALPASTFTISRGMVNTMSDIRGIDIWVNFTESADGVLCELRSKKYNINPVAVKYGGGGHEKASGATVPDYQTAMRMLDDLGILAEGGSI